MTQTSGTRPFSPPVFIGEIREKGLATRGYRSHTSPLRCEERSRNREWIHRVIGDVGRI